MIVISPTDRWIQSAFADCHESIRVSSPFVTGYLRDRIAELPNHISITLLTRTLITDFASRASDLDAVCAIAVRARGVVSLDSLHAKVYMVDDACALITSANATFAGMHRNAECGFEVRDRKTIDELREHFANGFGARHATKPWRLDELESLREPVEILRRSLPRMPRIPSATDQPAKLALRRSAFQKFIGGFHGWLRLTFEGVASLGKAEFTLNELFAACTPLIARQFPENNFPRPKVRQQLQRLRDLGVVRFLGNGRYELLTLPTK